MDIYVINGFNILFCQSLFGCKVSTAANWSAHSSFPLSTTYMWNIRRVHEEFIHRWWFISDICWCGINILQQSFLHLPEGALCLFSELQDSTQFCGRSLSGGDTYKIHFNLIVKRGSIFFCRLRVRGKTIQQVGIIIKLKWNTLKVLSWWYYLLLSEYSITLASSSYSDVSFWMDWARSQTQAWRIVRQNAVLLHSCCYRDSVIDGSHCNLEAIKR